MRNVPPNIAGLLRHGGYNPNTQSYWNNRYESGEYENVEDVRNGPLRQEVMKLDPPGSQVLDAGGGTGRFIEMLRGERLCHCTGIDISAISIETVKNKGFQAFKCKLPSLASNVTDNGYDVCTIVETFEDISDKQESSGKLMGRYCKIELSKTVK